MQKINELALAKELIRFPSITPIDAGVMSFLEKKLRILGFRTKIITFKDKKYKPIKNLYARLGNKGPNFCYAGHLDVVPPGNLNDWTVNPFKPKVKNGHLIGRGANDMKSSIAAFVSAVSIFLTENKNLNGLKVDNVDEKDNNLDVDDEPKPSRKERSIKAKIKEDEERIAKSNAPELELTESDNKIKDVNFLK